MELTREQISKLFELAGMDIEYSIANSNDITKALVSLEDKISCLSDVSDVKASDSKVLIVDDMELSTYQLSSLLKKVGVIPVVSRNKEDALNVLFELHYVVCEFLAMYEYIQDYEAYVEPKENEQENERASSSNHRQDR